MSVQYVEDNDYQFSYLRKGGYKIMFPEILEAVLTEFNLEDAQTMINCAFGAESYFQVKIASKLIKEKGYSQFKVHGDCIGDNSFQFSVNKKIDNSKNKPDIALLDNNKYFKIELKSQFHPDKSMVMGWVMENICKKGSEDVLVIFYGFKKKLEDEVNIERKDLDIENEHGFSIESKSLNLYSYGYVLYEKPGS